MKNGQWCMMKLRAGEEGFHRKSGFESSGKSNAMLLNFSADRRVGGSSNRF
jgi:hypothetical protein